MNANEFKRHVDGCHRVSDLTAVLNIAAITIADTAAARNEAIEYGFARRANMIEAAEEMGMRGAVPALT